ncbi:hypothetical protein DXT88_15470 [Herbaspirillum lusitanum]|uniref:hypothetical protein n=1 Tax=Herbaspirillum lusitanum TaxID=213312 RepID=UPI002238A0D0|nr:hypothetical protein [Herbaspirillum lusitanum]MCW5299575.1 hypothetical protein [Herbaspirillum lusitanum]
MDQNNYIDQDEENEFTLKWKLFLLTSNHLRQRELMLVAIRTATDFSKIDVTALLVEPHTEELRCVTTMRGSSDEVVTKLSDGYIEVPNKYQRQKGIGTVCFNEVVGWALAHHPTSILYPLKVFEHLSTEFPAEKRDAWYGRFGITFEYEPGRTHPMAQGESNNELISELRTIDVTEMKKIKQLGLPQFLHDVEAELVSMKRVKLEDDEILLRQNRTIKRLKLLSIGLSAVLIALTVFHFVRSA